MTCDRRTTRHLRQLVSTHLAWSSMSQRFEWTTPMSIRLEVAGSRPRLHRAGSGLDECQANIGIEGYGRLNMDHLTVQTLLPVAATIPSDLFR